MLERLGDVLYWGACGVALAVLASGALFAVIMFPDSDRWIFAGISAVAAFLVWLVGRSCRYVLAGR